METATIAHRSLPRLPSETSDRFPIKCHRGFGYFRVSERPRNSFGRLSARFSDCGNQKYCVLPRKETKKKEKEKSSEIKSVRKKLKLIKRLSSDLSLFSLEAFGKENASSLMNEEEISEAVEVLQAQLLQLRSEQKELKRVMKEKKAQIKTTMKQRKVKCNSGSSSSSSSSSSSESGDSDNGEVIDMIPLRSNILKLSENIEVQKEIIVPTVAKPATSLIQQDKLEACCYRSGGECRNLNCWSNDQSYGIVEGTTTTKIKRIEVCMGGKCKKLGAGALLEEFERKAGAECDVSMCKCMGKCRDGPNLRVSNCHDGDSAIGIQGYAKPSINSLCIGVGLEDVDMILANILGKDMNNNCMMAPS